MDYQVIARFRQPPGPNGDQSMIELRQYAEGVTRHVDGYLQDACWNWPKPDAMVEAWVAFERKIGSEMEQWVKLN